jgi:hypothetical protein
MRSTFGKIFPLLYSGVEAIAEAASTGTSLLVSNNSGAVLTKSTLAVAYSFGAITGAVEFITNYCFQGSVIRKRLSNDEVNYDIIYEQELEELLNGRISTRRKSAYLTLKYSYIATGLVVDYLGISLLYSATKAWGQDFSNGQDLPLTSITHPEAVMILFYYLLFDLPFILTTEMPQTCKEIRKMFAIEEHQMPDAELINKILAAAKFFAQSEWIRKFIRIFGSIADMLEHVIPLIIIIHPSWILWIASLNPGLAWGSAAAGSFFLLVVTATILAQTYLFEGKFSEKNLRSVVEQFGDELDEEKPSIHPTLAAIFHKLLDRKSVV